jgi:hypothetical protein
VRISTAMKLVFRDVKTGKPVASLPGSAPPEIKAEMKELSVLLREVAKAQTLRLENLMVRQQRWPAARWRALFLAHPVLAPFGVRLVWGCYDAAGNRVATFRALEDCSLTDSADSPVHLAEEAQVGIVHPLELSEEERDTWRSSLADYEITPPFPQLERPVVLADAALATALRGDLLVGTTINALTFRGRAERLGWYRGSVCDGGGVTAYWKRFPAAGVDVFLLLEGMYMGIDMYTDITLGLVFFVQTGSVKVGSYEYDEPSNETDPRLVPFGKVPPIAYSEVMSDLKRITLKKGTETNGDEGE